MRAWLLLAALLTSAVSQAAEPMRALIVGGGPDPGSNAAQIESHVRFVAGLLPEVTRRRLLFGDGKTNVASVATEPEGDDARLALSLLLPNSGLDLPVLMRPPQLGAHLDGPSTHEAIRRAFADLWPKSTAPLLIYFAGHGSQNDETKQVSYALWNDEDLSVRELDSELARLPARTPVTLVMAQCYSGGFADLLFRNADPKSGLASRDLAGFFSARKDRTASGCGMGTAAADYQDFSSYFFGALVGQDRFGKPVSGADADGDGRVTLHEAFCYALGHDESFDTPVCTSDVYLERFADLGDEDIFVQPYAELCRAATPAQRAALDLLSRKIGVDGEHRALDAYDRLTFEDPLGRLDQLSADRKSADELNRVRQQALRSLFAKWPTLRWSQSPGFAKAAESAAEDLAAGDILAAAKAHDDADAALDNEEAWLIRFTDLYRSIARAKTLREHGDREVKSRFERLWSAENATLPLAAVPTR